MAPGEKAVAVLVRVFNHGPADYDSAATSDLSLLTSGGAATPVFVSSGPCQTPLRDWDNYIAAGTEHSGCVAFGVHSGARLLAVRFSGHGNAGQRVSWVVG